MGAIDLVSNIYMLNPDKLGNIKFYKVRCEWIEDGEEFVELFAETDILLDVEDNGLGVLSNQIFFFFEDGDKLVEGEQRCDFRPLEIMEELTLEQACTLNAKEFPENQREIVEDDKERAGTFTLGIMLGYPECCALSCFGGPISFNGFIPCELHDCKTLEDAEKLVGRSLYDEPHYVDEFLATETEFEDGIRIFAKYGLKELFEWAWAKETELCGR